MIKTRQELNITTGYYPDHHETAIEKWYAPDTGLIKVTVYFNDGDYDIGELEEYNITIPLETDYLPMDIGNKWKYEWTYYEYGRSEGNRIYNNKFNNTNNSILLRSISEWNTTQTASTNIIGGSLFGGNFWGYPNGTGFSQTCTNTDDDGICDSPYVLDANNTDYLPLTSINTILPPIRFINSTVIDSINKTSISGVTLSANSTHSTTTNATGFYSFAVTEGTYDLAATYDIIYYTNTTTVSTIGQTVVWRDIELIKKLTGNITGSVTICLLNKENDCSFSLF